MFVASLGEGATTSVLLQHEGTNILFDCSAHPVLASSTTPGKATKQQQQQQQQRHQQQLDSPQLQLVVPDIAANLKDTQLHVILATSAWGLLGLAHLQQQLQEQGSDLPIHTYCTEPCLHFFQQLAQELLDAGSTATPKPPDQQQQQGLSTTVLSQHVVPAVQQQQQQPEHATAVNAAEACARPGGAGGGPRQQTTVPLFTAEQLQSVLDAVQVVRYGQRVQLPGSFGITAEARPCGRGIGSCLWLMTCGDQRYTYMGPATLQPNWSAPLHLPSMHNLDVLLLGPGCITPSQHQHTQPAGLQASVERQELCAGGSVSTALQAAAGAVSRGGRVLVPVIAGEGAVLQLLEQLPAALAAAASGPAQASTIPLVYLSPAAADFLATANSCCEYLEQQRQQQVLASGTPPLDTDQLVKSGQLQLLAPASQHKAGRQANQVTSAGAQAGASTAATAAGSGAGDQPMQLDLPTSGGTGAAGQASWKSGNREGDVSSSEWDALVQRVLSLGPCVVFVPLWSMAAGPGCMLAQAWSSNPLNLLLLPESGPLTASWLQQCCDANRLPPQQLWQWQVLYAPIACNSGRVAAAAGAGTVSRSAACEVLPAVQEGLLPEQLLAVLGGGTEGVGAGADADAVAVAAKAGRQCRVVASSADLSLLEAARQQQPPSLASPHVRFVPLPTAAATNSSPALQWQRLELPVPMVQAALSTELANRLQLQRLRVVKQPAAAATAAAGTAGMKPQLAGAAAGAVEEVHEVSVARLQAVLTHRSGCWRLEPLPTSPEAAAALQAQQQLLLPPQELLWGTVNPLQLLADLQAAGYKAELMPSGAGAASVQSISVDDGAAQIRLSLHETEVTCDSASMRKVLLQCLTSQLHRVQ